MLVHQHPRRDIGPNLLPKHSDSIDLPCDGRCPEIEPTQAHILAILAEGGLPSSHGFFIWPRQCYCHSQQLPGRNGIYCCLTRLVRWARQTRTTAGYCKYQFTALIKKDSTLHKRRHITGHGSHTSSTGVDGIGVPALSCNILDRHTIYVPRGPAAAGFRRMVLDRIALP